MGNITAEDCPTVWRMARAVATETGTSIVESVTGRAVYTTRACGVVQGMRHSAVMANLATARINREVSDYMINTIYKQSDHPIQDNETSTPFFSCTTGADNVFAVAHHYTHTHSLSHLSLSPTHTHARARACAHTHMKTRTPTSHALIF